MRRRILLLSNSRNPGQGFLEHATEPIRQALGGAREVAFVPFAGVTLPFAPYTDIVREHFKALGCAVRSVHEAEEPEACIRGADAIVVGGGNTFHLLYHVYSHKLIDAIRDRVNGGTPYIGWSAGANLACPTIMTTNDMPIIAPPRFDALALVPFQINPHYLDHNPADHGGETREQRIMEFVEVNPDVVVLGLREGTMLRVDNSTLELIGDRPMRVFKKGWKTAEIEPGDPIDHLLG